MDLNNIRYIIMDVDGTLTDSGVYYDEHGNELKKFSTKDGTGFVAARYNDIKLIVMTGRECQATTRRMTELGVHYIFQNVRDKEACLASFMKDNNVKMNEIAYIGDDLNDLGCMRMVGYIGCPADSCEEVITIANYVSKLNGGHGAVRDVIEHILRETGRWEETIEKMYGKINPYVQN